MKIFIKKIVEYMEIFKEIKGYENLYQVSNQGRIYGVKRGKFLRPLLNNNGYMMVNLCKDNKLKKCLIHRLVANAFIPNPLNLSDVNHRSEIKTDNRVENLEWMSHKENCNYGMKKIKVSKKILQFTKDGKFVKEYPSAIEASRQTRISNQSISQCCLGKTHSAGKYIWKFKEVV
jgi:hypothetical protein